MMGLRTRGSHRSLVGLKPVSSLAASKQAPINLDVIGCWSYSQAGTCSWRRYCLWCVWCHAQDEVGPNHQRSTND